MSKTFSQFKKIILENRPLIDVRAPIEFEKGSFNNTVNLPLMNNEERHIVGITYKEKGQAEAIKLGHQLVSGKIKEARIKAWVDFLKVHPNAYLFCFRGGLRSQLSQQWIYEVTGKEIPRLEGGYKAFRNYLLDVFEPSNLTSIPIRIGGYTGTGKTKLLNQIPNSINLEALANHRGSAFGNHITDQPTQINYENSLAYQLIKHNEQGYRHLILEDEGLNIGKNFNPKSFYDYFSSSKLIILEVPFEQRVQNTFNEYVKKSQNSYIHHFGIENGLIEWYQYICKSMNKLKKRLGGECFKRTVDTLEAAFIEQLKSGNNLYHQNWIEMILKEYYDPMYQYQIKKNEDKIIFKGNTLEILDYVNNYIK